MAWMRRDVVSRLIPFTMLTVGVWAWRRPRWLGFSPGRAGIQVAVGTAGSLLGFAGGAALRMALTRRGDIRVPAGPADALLQAGYFFLNAPVEEAMFRGLLQGGVGRRVGTTAGMVAGTVPYVLYHRLGGWSWGEVGATALIGVPLAFLYRLLPGRPSLLAVSLAHAGATCGFIGLGPWILQKLRLL